MKRVILALAALLGLTSPAYAQFVVTDPGVQATTTTIATGVQSANAQLIAIARSAQAMATTTANMLMMLRTPTPIVGAFNVLDGGARVNSAAAINEFMPILAGVISTSPFARALLEQERVELAADEAEGLTTGNSKLAQALRQRLVGTNLQGQAYGDLRTYGTRFLAANAMEARLSTVQDVKQALTWNGGIALESWRTLNLLGQSISLNTAAVTEARLQVVSDILRIRDDHRQTALLFATRP